MHECWYNGFWRLATDPQDRLDELALGVERPDVPKDSYAFWETQPVAQFKEDDTALQTAQVLCHMENEHAAWSAGAR